jgi:hypothetical protein
MTSVAVETLRAAIDELAAAEIVGVSQREDVAALWCELARLDAQFARRVGEFDRSAEWSADGARAAAVCSSRRLGPAPVRRTIG